MKETIHFAHGNGFPSACYRQLFNALSDSYFLQFIDKVGHSKEFPVTENWHYLIDEVTKSVRAQKNKPVIALGHSLGGVLSFASAVENPELYKAVILLDSPIIGRLKSSMLRLSKRLGFIDHLTPAFRTKGRRQHWPSRESAIEYLRSRALFSSFSEACLQDYVDYGLQQDDNGYVLRFDRSVEYHIYRTIPHVLHRLEGKLKTPTAVIYGSKSDVIKPNDLAYMKKHYISKAYEIEGSHMFPMENPEETAHLVRKALDELGIS